MSIRLIDQHQTGLLPEHRRLRILGGGIPVSARMTIPAREAFQAVATGAGAPEASYCYATPPAGVVAVLAPRMHLGAPTGDYAPAFRLECEEPYPHERPCQDMWLAAALAACPKCGHALAWYEAGHVPGYRVCAGPRHHHYIVDTARPAVADAACALGARGGAVRSQAKRDAARRRAAAQGGVGVPKPPQDDD